MIVKEYLLGSTLVLDVCSKHGIAAVLQPSAAGMKVACRGTYLKACTNKKAEIRECTAEPSVPAMVEYDTTNLLQPVPLTISGRGILNSSQL